MFLFLKPDPVFLPIQVFRLDQIFPKSALMMIFKNIMPELQEPRGFHKPPMHTDLLLLLLVYPHLLLPLALRELLLILEVGCPLPRQLPSGRLLYPHLVLSRQLHIPSIIDCLVKAIRLSLLIHWMKLMI
jgi:hypothetical protein